MYSQVQAKIIAVSQKIKPLSELQQLLADEGSCQYTCLMRDAVQQPSLVVNHRRIPGMVYIVPIHTYPVGSKHISLIFYSSGSQE